VIDIFSSEDEKFIYMHVRDNGRGIDTVRHKDKLFGLYQRFHLHTEGKGLGLYISKTHAENLGGRVEMKSKPDEGTTVIVAFPKEPFCVVSDSRT